MVRRHRRALPATAGSHGAYKHLLALGVVGVALVIVGGASGTSTAGACDVTTGGVNRVTETSARVTATANGGQCFGNFDFLYATTSPPNADTPDEPGPGSGSCTPCSFARTLTDLEPSTTYYVQARHDDPGIETDLGAIVSFKTKAAGPPPLLPENYSADVGVQKRASAATVRVGDPITYAEVVTNYGPGTAIDVLLTDPLPAGLTLVSATTTRGSCSGSVTCSMGELEPGEAATVTIVTKATAVGKVTNTAAVGAKNPDPNVGANNRSTATVTVAPQLTELELRKSASVSTVTVGDRITYTEVVTNAGKAAAADVVLSDPLPTGLQDGNVVQLLALESATATKGTCSAAVVCSIGALAPGESATVTIVARVTRNRFVQPITNTAAVEASNASRQQASVTATVRELVARSAELNLTVVSSGGVRGAQLSGTIAYSRAVASGFDPRGDCVERVSVRIERKVGSDPWAAIGTVTSGPENSKRQSHFTKRIDDRRAVYRAVAVATARSPLDCLQATSNSQEMKPIEVYRRVTLDVDLRPGHLLASGTVGLARAFDDPKGLCTNAVPVLVQRQVEGGWAAVATVTTDAAGTYELKINDSPLASYRATAVATEQGIRDCLADMSPIASAETRPMYTVEVTGPTTVTLYKVATYTITIRSLAPSKGIFVATAKLPVGALYVGATNDLPKGTGGCSNPRTMRYDGIDSIGVGQASFKLPAAEGPYTKLPWQTVGCLGFVDPGGVAVFKVHVVPERSSDKPGWHYVEVKGAAVAVENPRGTKPDYFEPKEQGPGLDGKPKQPDKLAITTQINCDPVVEFGALRLVYPVKLKDIAEEVSTLEAINANAAANPGNPGYPTYDLSDALPEVPLDLRGCALRDKNWNRTFLVAADLRNTVWTGVNVSRSDLRGAQLDRAKVDDIGGARLGLGPQTDLTLTKLDHASFRNADFSGAQFDGSTMTRTDFTGADLSYASLVGTRMIESRVFSANFYAAHLEGAIVIRVGWDGAPPNMAYTTCGLIPTVKLAGIFTLVKGNHTYFYFGEHIWTKEEKTALLITGFLLANITGDHYIPRQPVDVEAAFIQPFRNTILPREVERFKQATKVCSGGGG